MLDGARYSGEDLHYRPKSGVYLALGLVSRTVVAGFQATCCAALIRSVSTSHARCGYRQSALQRLGFGQARLFARFDPSGSASDSARREFLAARMGRFGSTKHGACCTVRLRGWAAARRAQVPGNGGLTSRSSRCRFAARLNSGVRR